MTMQWQHVKSVSLAAGLCAVGVTDAAAFPRAFDDLVERKAEGLHGGIEFTYRNPARSTDPSATMPDARSLIVGALDFTRREPPRPNVGPSGRVASYSWTDHYAALREGLQKVADLLREGGHRAQVFADQNNLVDRAAAYRAGLGWWGKSSNILIPGVGSMVVLGAVMTNAEISGNCDEPMADHCGQCTKCISGCPTSAIVAPGVVDARRCLSWLLQLDGEFPMEFRKALGDRIYGCDDCQDVCPPNQVRLRHASISQSDEAWVPILEMLALDDESLLDKYGRWYIPRRDPDVIRRNALVVLGNIGDGTDPATRSVLQSALHHSNEMVRSHAAWAQHELGISTGSATA